MVAGKIPWTEEPGGLQSTGSQRVGHGLAVEHVSNRGERTKWAATGQRVQRRWPQQQGAPSQEGRGGQGGVAVRRWARMQTLEGGTWQSVVPLKPSGSVPALGRGTIIGMGRWHREFLESGNV